MVLASVLLMPKYINMIMTSDSSPASFLIYLYNKTGVQEFEINSLSMKKYLMLIN